jgi:AcrR family transcriptional regulator
MTAMAEFAVKQSARERLLASANELFYDEGIQTVGIDRIIEHAGVAKASLYNTFGSKDELIRAYLELRAASRREAIAEELAKASTPRDRLLAVFNALERSVRRPGFHGCAFMNATAEAPAGSAAEQVSQQYRRWVSGLLVELATDAGAADPALLAGQLRMLYDGATISARMDHDRGVAVAARAAAAALIDGASAPTAAAPTRPRRAR